MSARRSATTVSDALAPVYLVRGDDPSVLAQAVHNLLRGLVGDRDPSLVLEEHGGPSADELDVGAVIDAFSTPPFLVDRRIVVVRDAGRLTAADAGRLVEVLSDPPPMSVLLLVSGGGTIPQGLVKAAGAVGQVVDAGVGTGKSRVRWIEEQVDRGSVQLTPRALHLLTEHLGEDVGRLAGLLDMLATAYGQGSRVDVDELAPFLGEAGSVPPWDLTDAIDAGRTEDALAALHRQLGAGGRSAPEVLGAVHRHFAQMLALEGSGASTAEEAAALLGARSTFVARKALQRSSQLGFERIGQAILLLARADLDIKGETGVSPELVLEVLVARLSRLSRTRGGRRR